MWPKSLQVHNIPSMHWSFPAAWAPPVPPHLCILPAPIHSSSHIPFYILGAGNRLLKGLELEMRLSSFSSGIIGCGWAVLSTSVKHYHESKAEAQSGCRVTLPFPKGRGKLATVHARALISPSVSLPNFSVRWWSLGASLQQPVPVQKRSSV